MGLILDTNIIILLERKPEKREKLFANFVEEKAFLSVISASELLAGIELAETLEEKITREIFVDNILKEMPILPFDLKVAKIYATLYAHCLKQKRRSSQNSHDLQIAATALAHGYPILTENTKDFRHIPGVALRSLG